MFHQFSNLTADGLWRQLYLALHGSDAQGHAGRGGRTHELLHATLCLEDPRQRWITSRRPALNLAFALAEVIWIVTGRNDAAFLTYFFPRISEYMGYSSAFPGAYGERLRHRFGLDQLDRAHSALRADLESRQIVLQIWDPAADLPSLDGQPAARDIPCNLLSLLKVRDGRLEWTQIMRSNDLYRGFPHNIVQFTSLQEITAGWLDLEVGHYHHFSDSLHFYDNAETEFGFDADSLNKATNTDSLACSRTESDRNFELLARQVDRIINPMVTVDVLAADFDVLELSPAHRNIACVLYAEGARRRHAMTVASQFMEHCTNPAYVELQNRWLQRVHKPS